jgi:hypothetical protein
MVAVSQGNASQSAGRSKASGTQESIAPEQLEIISTYPYGARMAYELGFLKKVAAKNPESYINECCWGGDEVRDHLLPLISGTFADVETNQEDWGWFIWFRKGPTRLAIDIFCDDPKSGAFRVHLSSRRKRLLFTWSFVDAPELQEVKDLVCAEIQVWAGSYQIKRSICS